MFLLFEWDPFHPCVSRSNQIEISFYAHLRGRIGFKTVNPSLSTGKDFLIHSLGKDWWWEECTHPTKTREFLDPFTAKRRDVLGNPSLDKISNPLCRAAKPVLPIYAETMSVHCLESGWIGKSIPLGLKIKYLASSIMELSCDADDEQQNAPAKSNRAKLNWPAAQEVTSCYYIRATFLRMIAMIMLGW